MLSLILLSASLIRAAGRPEETADGRVLYLQYCASCHGIAVDGRGPVASVLRTQPTDLRRLGDAPGSPFAAERLARFVDGRAAVVAHGPREMPVWGERFATPEPEDSGRPATIDERIRKIVAYLQTVQERHKDR